MKEKTFIVPFCEGDYGQWFAIIHAENGENAKRKVNDKYYKDGIFYEPSFFGIWFDAKELEIDENGIYTPFYVSTEL